MSAQLQDPLLGLRPMQVADLPQVMAIEEAVYPHPWTLGIFQDCLRVGYCCWVVNLDQQVIGYGVMSVVIDESHILNICIDPTWQGKGLAIKLIRRLLKIARQHGAETVYLEVRVGNKPAIGLYKKLGFVEIGQRRDYYPDRNRSREDALMMSLEL
ncbi:MAG: ribosomal protein S18-alanine N-acetyltransferase [Candidatus Thiodiazotropha sp. (ex. Lucinisca nassula)]|nr:ribosomal protein S18-alanine N-acetyltransferase [Candidatus Thiodiazotropha sp. (ex. Lucinisca nassula)]PUB83530.1 MAG: ribosomal-protein-alanine N-acetyltransferase [gamma proteobacterium symbiont of Ctena orbiculata]PUB85299.1 MAG: ribosomal-protein-alanine N-acetyltransferase [gamma proteobacterium symbiont of Ctena orbiculata]